MELSVLKYVLSIKRPAFLILSQPVVVGQLFCNDFPTVFTTKDNVMGCYLKNAIHCGVSLVGRAR